MIFNKGDVSRAGSAGCPVRIGIDGNEELYKKSMVNRLQFETVTRNARHDEAAEKQ
jgi:hypothetical protein